mgnify:CR=1 FL=1
MFGVDVILRIWFGVIDSWVIGGIAVNGIRRLLIASVVLGFVSLGFFILERLAMTDIFHGEPDLGLESSIVSISFLPIFVFHLVSVVAAIVALRRVGRDTAIQ